MSYRGSHSPQRGAGAFTTAGDDAFLTAAIYDLPKTQRMSVHYPLIAMDHLYSVYTASTTSAATPPRQPLSPEKKARFCVRRDELSQKGNSAAKLEIAHFKFLVFGLGWVCGRWCKDESSHTCSVTAACTAPSCDTERNDTYNSLVETGHCPFTLKSLYNWSLKRAIGGWVVREDIGGETDIEGIGSWS